MANIKEEHLQALNTQQSHFDAQTEKDALLQNELKAEVAELKSQCTESQSKLKELQT